MELKDFVANFAEQFEETDSTLFTLDTEFKKLEEWSSLHSLMLIAMIDSEYNVVISGDDIVKSKTIGDLYKIVNER